LTNAQNGEERAQARGATVRFRRIVTIPRVG